MSEAVKTFYNEYGMDEVKRLSSLYCKFEYQNNLRLMSKYLPKYGEVLDVGAGPGLYSLPLLKKGYKVTLFDISEVQLSIAQAEFEKENVSAEDLICADARQIDTLPDEKYDAILLMGPLYHIIDESDRMKVLNSTYRKLKCGGIALIEFINAWGVLRAGFHEFPWEYVNKDLLVRYLSPFTINATEEPDSGFTDVYLTTPAVASETLKMAGFEVLSYAGTESIASGMKSSVEFIHQKFPAAFDNILDVSFSACEMHPYRDMTEHLTFIVKKPE